ncbi:MAG: hypothetical protein KGQ48_04310 [Bradyrhizobium sp.]|nr:hypothetical protein [Bradyrhizobium sp.]
MSGFCRQTVRNTIKVRPHPDKPASCIIWITTEAEWFLSGPGIFEFTLGNRTSRRFVFSIWAYGKYSAVKSWLMSFAAWQLVWRWSRIARQTGQRDKRAASRSPIAAHLKP